MMLLQRIMMFCHQAVKGRKEFYAKQEELVTRRYSHVRLNALRGSLRRTRGTKDASLIAVASVKLLANVSPLLKYVGIIEAWVQALADIYISFG